MTDEEHNLERIINYLNKKNLELPESKILSPKEVILYYGEMKAINRDKAFIRTLNYVDEYIKEFKK